MGTVVELHDQVNCLSTMIENSSLLDTALKIIENIGGTQFWIAGDTICKTVWNSQLRNPSDHCIGNVGIVYHTPVVDDNQWLRLKEVEDILKYKCNQNKIHIHVQNLARADEDFQVEFHGKRHSFNSLNDGIKHYHAICECVAVRRDSGKMRLIAPFGLDDLLNHTYRYNHMRTDRRAFECKGIAFETQYPFLVRIG